MRLKAVAVSVLTISVLSACSGINREQAEGSFEYVDYRALEPLEAAPGLNLPQPARRYAVPEIANTDAEVGKDVTVKAPVQVRPIAEGARIEEGDTRTRVFFDDVEDVPNLTANVWRAIQQTLAARDIQIAEQEAQAYVLTEVTTEREEIEKPEQSFWSLSDEFDTFETEFQYRVKQETESHGRTTAVAVELVSFKQNKNGEVIPNPPQLAQRAAEATLLNQVIASVYNIQQEVMDSVATKGIGVELGFSAEGDPAYLIDTDFETAWSLTETTFEELGFDVDDLNKSEGRYYLEYQRNTGVMATLAFWRSKSVAELNLPEGEYEVVLMDTDDQVSLTIEFEGSLVSPETMDLLFEDFAAEFKQQSQL